MAAASVETPAARLLAGWFAAFNGDDFAASHAFHGKHLAPLPEEADEGFRAATGGFEIKRVAQPSPTTATAIVKERKSDQFALAELEVDPKDPEHVTRFELNATDTPDEYLTAQQRKLRSVDDAKRRALIDRIAKELAEHYVYPDKATAMIAAVRDHLTHGDYDKITAGGAFAKQLTDDLRAVSHDLHLGIRFGRAPQPDGPPPGKDEQLAQLRRMNFGFGPIARLSGNVAHLVINAFPEAKLDEARDAIGALMTQIADADALVIDLRGNGGGSPETVALVASYVFDATPVHLNDMYWRNTGKTTQSWTLAKVPGKRFGGHKPVYVLTSKRTFSGGEEFAYDLQNLKRAKLIGETTGGGAHPTDGITLDDWFQLAVPVARAINPVTHTSWEGTGVVPDIAISADAALDEALRRHALP